MSDVGRVKRPGGSPFPSVRKSSDPFVPEMGEIEFSQEVEEFDNHLSTAVQEAEKTEQNVITEENRNKQYRQRKKNDKDNEEEEQEEPLELEHEEALIDLTA